MKVIMISGKAGHGKDTIAQLIKEELEKREYRVLVIKFGDPVKWFAREYYHWNGEKDFEGRALLQNIGTTIMRSYDKYYWGNIISEFIAANNDFDVALIPDWRFFSEEEAIEKYNKNYFTIRVNRPNYINPNMSKEQLNHVSETELDNAAFNWIIENNGTIENLKESVNYILDNENGLW